MNPSQEPVATAKSSWQQKRGVWVAAIVALLVVVVLVLFVWPGYLGTFAYAPDRESSFGPLVFHTHNKGGDGACYDDGSTFCEQRMGAQKAHTAVFLFRNPPRSVPYTLLYGCVNLQAPSQTSKYLLTTDRQECKQQNLNSYVTLGYVAKSMDFENSTKISYCPGTGQLLLGDQSADVASRCKELGYATAALTPLMYDKEALCHELSLHNSSFGHELCSDETSESMATKDDLGDVDKNGVVNADDVAKLLAFAKGQAPLNEIATDNADVDPDGKLTVSDILLLQASVAGKVVLPARFGDVTQSGTLSGLDSSLISRHSVELEKIPDKAVYLADLDGDGYITGVDATRVGEMAVGLRVFPPIVEDYAKQQDIAVVFYPTQSQTPTPPTPPTRTPTPTPTPLPSPTPPPAAGGVSLSRVSIDNCQVFVSYSKDFATCGHILNASGTIMHQNNYFCQNQGSITLERSQMNSQLQPGTQVKICNGNNYNQCSSLVTVTGGGTCAQ